MQLAYSGANKSGKLNILLEILAAVFLGGSAFAVFLSMFSLSWTPASAFGGSVGGGLARVWNGICDTLGSKEYIILGKVAVKSGAGSAPESFYCGLFLTIVLAVLVLLSFFIIKSRLRPLLLLPVVPMAAMAVVGVFPDLVQGFVFGAAVLTALCVMNIKGSAGLPVLIVPAAGLLLAAALAAVIDYTVTFDEPAPLSNAGRGMREWADSARYGTDPLPHGKIGSISGEELKERRGSIDDVKKAFEQSASEDPGKGKTALTLTMDRPESLYLRGFVGADLAENTWTAAPNGKFYEMRNKVYWLNKQGFDGLTEMASASALAGWNRDVNNIDVRVKNASKNIAFTPYELTTGDGWTDDGPIGDGTKKLPEVRIPDEYKNYGGSHLGNRGFAGSASYSYQAAGNITGAWTDAVGKFYTTKGSDLIPAFFVSESNYNVIQYDNYVDISDAHVAAIRKEIGSPGDITKNHADYKYAITTIKNYLNDNYVYSETFKASKKGSDLVTDFIKAKRGSDMHFATLAALMFRYFGIPARYVEGYLISEKSVSGMGEGSADVNVPRSANHAWAEIYIDGFGWVPIETTPEYSGVMKEADMSKGLKNVDYESKQKQKNRHEEDEEEEEPEETKSTLMDLIMKIVIAALATLAGLLLLALLFFLIRRIVRWAKWRLAFRDKDPRNGVRALYQFGNEKKWAFSGGADALGLRASYSESEITERDRTYMRKELKDAKERTRTS